MTSSAADQPHEQDAANVLFELFGEPVTNVRRFPTGIGHWVYEVRTEGTVRVVKMGLAAQHENFAGAVHWSTVLRPLGVPLPELLAHGTRRGLPYAVLEYLEGEDLGRVYSILSPDERRAIAERVWDVQNVLAKLPHEKGYGFMRVPGGSLHPSWAAVVDASIARSRGRIETARVVDSRWVERVSKAAQPFSAYFAQVAPRAFLDDATTKNVLVHDGQFSGIVDVDWLCFGDPLFTVALTRAAILYAGNIPDYTDHWCALLGVTQQQQAAVRFYTALFCLDFMSELGQTFNREREAIAPERVERLESVLERHLDAA
ncbi:MAG TPA: aminoglycoside phosphotransferase family protein [Polyangiaceae bacterium]|nr:aminoglycoside phosphotransferase family protein [Polyangiaceae bacterium]